MVLTPHLLAGAIIVTEIPNLLGFVLAFLSHYLLDFIPHVEYSILNIKTKKWKKIHIEFLKIALDLFLGIFLIWHLMPNFILALWGGFFGILPDGFTILYFLFPKNKLLKKHYLFHSGKVHFFKDKKISSKWRISSQLLIIFLIIILIK